MPFITIDSYYTLPEFHKCLSALKSHDIKLQTFICTKAPYNWYFKVDDTTMPKFVFYDLLPDGYERFLVSTIVPNTSADEFNLFRREKGLSKGRYVLNDAFKDAQMSDYACVFNLANKEEGIQLSRRLGGRIWYLGKYYNIKYKLCICTSEYIKDFVPRERILVEKSDNDIGRFESSVNYEIMYRKDYIQKFSQTPYFEDGQYVLPTPIVQNMQRFINF